ncbi:lysine-rich arabinogalactan protein 19 [Cynara cardunculus var. scolymus]|uniref:lysine-rich arabinogalactan protein 19 n=1 Tax=Cynara cardunculus var. scolymus TaxID=59895 RepID=UPI000D62E60B|nr:lysine-rich arabinogalactan protein 19 [Cynara cardunculus var. scolymus]XP_024964154.1 lysine-rich arabinogalactan protein 19 [Cynara cardunculus var. scolymus]
MPINKEPATPPMIGKIGPYTVFVTPPPTPKPSSEPSIASVSELPKRKNVSPSPVKFSPPIQPPVAKSAPPVLPPPVQYEKSASAYDSKYGFFWDAVAKVQNAHSSLDEYVARWFGLNQSKYQWALDDYYEKKGVDHVDAKVKDASTKAQSV